MILRNLPIRKKLTFIMMLNSISALLLISISFMIVDISGFRDDAESRLRTVAQITAFNSTAAISFSDKQAATQNLNSMSAIPSVHYAAILTPDGELFAKYHDENFDLINATTHQNVLINIGSDCDRSSFSINKLIICQTINLNNEEIGKLYMMASLTGLYIDLRHRAIIALIILVLGILTTYLFVKKLGNIIADPITSLSNTITDITENKDYSIRTESNSNDEVGLLSNGFNAMLNQIHKQDQELRTHRNKLEEEVAARTNELFNTVSKLEKAKIEAEKANLAKSEFLSQMSHELRTPMNAILGYAQLMLLDKNDPVSESHLEDINEIIYAGNHLLELINKILNLSHIESGALEVSIENIYLNDCIEECITLVGPLATEREITIINNCDNEIHVSADYTHVKQVLINILSNGIKYNNHGGTLTIDDCSHKESRACLSITDTGQGLSQLQIEGLFKPFERLGAEKTTVEGTGIGLVISQRLLKLMHGDISAASTLGEGTIFSITLNKVAPPVQQKSSQKIVGNPLSTSHPDLTGHILYIEDNTANLRLVELLVTTHMGMEFTGAPDAYTGIELAKDLQPDLILMDINLPGMDGFDALKELQKENVTATIPVIALSANAMQRDISRGRKAGFIDYITKPIQFDQLSMAIVSAIGSKGTYK